MTIHFSSQGEVSVVRLDDEDADGYVDRTSLIIDDLPSFIYDAHSNNGIAIGPDGLLYLTLGAQRTRTRRSSACLRRSNRQLGRH